MSDLLGRDELFDALRALDEELQRLGVQADLFVVGGAAMAIAYDARRATADVDAIFVPTKAVRDAAKAVASQLGLAEDWLNDSVKAFLPGSDDNRVIVYEGDGLRVSAASPEFLLAMKLLASRGDRDQDDIRTLYKMCGMTTADEGLDLVARYYPDRLILPRVSFLLQEMFPAREIEDDGGRGL
jgi:Nucleotidyltransferase of unknown function (DUF6036)